MEEYLTNQPMRTEDLEEYMLSDPFIRQYYGGVVALDQLPILFSKPRIYIVNSDPASEAGTHWYALYFDKISEHFDSSGFKPISVLENHLVLHGPKYMYNNVRVQNFDTNSCGLFCLFYSYFRCRNYSFKDIMNMFSDNLQLNENLVNYFYKLTV